jgi:hypothetical protein
MLLTLKTVPEPDGTQDRNRSLDRGEQATFLDSEGSRVQRVDEDRASRVSAPIACNSFSRREARVRQNAIPSSG